MLQDPARETERLKDIGSLQDGIGSKHILDGVACGKKIDHRLGRDPRPFKHGFAAANIRNHDDAFLFLTVEADYSFVNPIAFFQRPPS